MFDFQISQKKGTQDVKITFVKKSKDFQKTEVVYVDRFDKVLPKLEVAALNPSFENSTTCDGANGLESSVVTIKNVAAGGKTFYLSVTDCDGAVETSQVNYTVRPWWWDSIASFLISILLILIYFLLVGFGLWGAIRVQYRVREEGMVRTVISWVGFALGFFLPTLQGIPIALGFTEIPKSASPAPLI